MRPADLRKLAEQHESEGVRLAESGDTAASVTLLLKAANLRVTADELEARLTDVRYRGTDVAVKPEAEKPTGQRKPLDRTPSQLVQRAGQAGYSLRGLAEAVGEHHAYLSMAHAGKRPIKRAVAEKIQKLTGFEASPANWPGGIGSTKG